MHVSYNECTLGTFMALADGDKAVHIGKSARDLPSAPVVLRSDLALSTVLAAFLLDISTVFAELSQNIDLVRSSSSRLKKEKGKMVFCYQNCSDLL